MADKINASSVKFRIAYHGHSARIKDIPPNDPYFFSIRNPIDRFYSAFYMRKRKEQPRLYREWKESEREAYALFPEATELAEHIFSDSPLARHAFVAMQSIGHLSFQHRWFELRELMRTRPPLAILRQARLAEDCQSLLVKLGVEAPIGLPEDSTQAHRNDYSGALPLSEKAIANLEKWYAVDIEYYKILNQLIEEGTFEENEIFV
jgi:hypothetical protein